MSFPGPLSITPINYNPADQLVGLRAFQRITAQVVSVAGTTAVLEVDGHPVVAQLTSADQSNTLASKSTAQFIVTQLTDNSVTLKLVQNELSQPALVGVPANGPELAERMLASNNLPATATNLMLTRSLLKQQLPVTPELLKELQNALSDVGSWGEAEADLAAAMKSAGLPVTGKSLALAARQPAQTAQALSSLMAALSQSAAQGLPEELMQKLRSNLQTLNSIILKADGEPSQLADQLKAWVDAFGRSLENALMGQMQNPETAISETGLASLAKLQEMLEQLGRKDTARQVREFLTDVRREQLMNVRPDGSRQEDWLQLGFVVQNAAQKAQEKFSSARLRIAREHQTDTVNPANTRLILQVDLTPTETVEVDLSFAGRQVRTAITSPDPQWCQNAQDELPALTEALNSLGYSLKDFQVEMRTPQPFSRLQSGTGDINWMTVNIEV